MTPAHSAAKDQGRQVKRETERKTTRERKECVSTNKTNSSLNTYTPNQQPLRSLLAREFVEQFAKRGLWS